MKTEKITKEASLSVNKLSKPIKVSKDVLKLTLTRLRGDANQHCPSGRQSGQGDNYMQVQLCITEGLSLDFLK